MNKNSGNASCNTAILGWVKENISSNDIKPNRIDDFKSLIKNATSWSDDLWKDRIRYKFNSKLFPYMKIVNYWATTKIIRCVDEHTSWKLTPLCIRAANYQWRRLLKLFRMYSASYCFTNYLEIRRTIFEIQSHQLMQRIEWKTSCFADDFSTVTWWMKRTRIKSLKFYCWNKNLYLFLTMRLSFNLAKSIK